MNDLMKIVRFFAAVLAVFIMVLWWIIDMIGDTLNWIGLVKIFLWYGFFEAINYLYQVYKANYKP